LTAREDILLDHNEKREDERDFDEFYDDRRNFGETIEKLSKLLTPKETCVILNNKLEEAIKKQSGKT